MWGSVAAGQVEGWLHVPPRFCITYSSVHGLHKTNGFATYAKTPMQAFSSADSPSVSLCIPPKSSSEVCLRDAGRGLCFTK